MDYKNDMIDIITRLTRKERLATVFTDFVKLSAISISNAVDESKREQREREYLQITRKYKAEELELFTQLLADLVLELEGNMRDVLGELYMELRISDDNTAQVFTPWHIAQFMAETISDEEDSELTTIGDACVGSGVMIIAQALVLRNKGINYQKKLRVVCSDIDRDVLLMCYLQLSLLGIDAVCERKNALLDEKGERWYTPFHVLNNS